MIGHHLVEVQLFHSVIQSTLHSAQISDCKCKRKHPVMCFMTNRYNCLKIHLVHIQRLFVYNIPMTWSVLSVALKIAESTIIMSHRRFNVKHLLLEWVCVVG